MGRKLRLRKRDRVKVMGWGGVGWDGRIKDRRREESRMLSE